MIKKEDIKHENAVQIARDTWTELKGSFIDNREEYENFCPHYLTTE